MSDNKRYDIALLLLRLAFGGAMIYGHGWYSVDEQVSLTRHA